MGILAYVKDAIAHSSSMLYASWNLWTDDGQQDSLSRAESHTKTVLDLVKILCSYFVDIVRRDAVYMIEH